MKNEKMFCSLASDVTAPWTTARQSWAPPPAPHEHLPTSARHRLRPFATRRKARQDAWFPGMPGADATRFSAEEYDYDNPEHQNLLYKTQGSARVSLHKHQICSTYIAIPWPLHHRMFRHRIVVTECASGRMQSCCWTIICHTVLVLIPSKRC